MSTPHPTHVRTTLTVDRETADVLRDEAKKVAMFEHELFEDFVGFSPGAQYGLSLRYRDVFDLIDAVGWNPDKTDPVKLRFKVPLTDDLIDMLGLRHEDLALTIKNRFDEHAGAPPSEILEEITTDRLAIGALERLFQKYARAIRA
jgi:hypothetical protein